MKDNTPFLSFYTKNKISPVRQDITDLNKHFLRRSSLYRHLGLPICLMKNKQIIEFGPGGGHNSLYIISLKPNKHTLVDGNPTGIESLKKLFSTYYPDYNTYKVIESNVLDYRENELYDIVLAEGLIQLQDNPKDFAKHLSGFTKPGGVFVITTCDHISFFSETLRRLIAHLIIDKNDALDNQVNLLLPIFTKHANNLKSMSRPVEDWLIDTLIIPFTGKLFSIPEAIHALGDNFEVYKSSPDFLIDWRWYKEINSLPLGFNQLGEKSYWENAHNLLDYREVTTPREKSKNVELYELCKLVYNLEQSFENTKDSSLLQNIILVLRDVQNNIRKDLPSVDLILLEFINYFENSEANPKNLIKNPTPLFDKFFGRGMQYLSLTRNIQ